MFEFDKNQNLLVDCVYFDPRFPSYIFVDIDGAYYKMRTAGNDWKNGHDIAALLQPAPHYTPAEKAKTERDTVILSFMLRMARKDQVVK